MDLGMPNEEKPMGRIYYSPVPGPDEEKFSMNQFLHLVETLDTHIDRIRTDLGADWPGFAAQVQSLAPAFETAGSETELARAVADLYLACREREPVMGILRETADVDSPEHDRRPPAEGSQLEDEMLIREVVNRFQSLLAKLERIESSSETMDDQSEKTTTSGGSN